MRELTPGTFTGLCDVGYLSFTLGIKAGMRRWGKERVFFKDTLMVLDAKFNHRYLIEPNYKSHRKEKRRSNPETMAKHEMAQRFRQLLRQDPTVASIEMHGFEADDVLAYLYIMGWGTQSAIAADKDLYQVPGLRDIMCNKDGEQTERLMKLPKYHPQPHAPQEYVIAQILRGDKSDQIPRLLPSSGPAAKAIFERLVTPYPGDYDRQLWGICYEFGHEPVIHNLLLCLMPSPFMSRLYTGRLDFNHKEDYFKRLIYQIDQMELLRSVIDGSYWSRDNFDERHIQILQETRAAELAMLWDDDDKSFDIYKQERPIEEVLDELEGEFWSQQPPKQAVSLYPPEENFID